MKLSPVELIFLLRDKREDVEKGLRGCNLYTDQWVNYLLQFWDWQKENNQILHESNYHSIFFNFTQNYPTMESKFSKLGSKQLITKLEKAHKTGKGAFADLQGMAQVLVKRGKCPKEFEYLTKRGAMKGWQDLMGQKNPQAKVETGTDKTEDKPATKTPTEKPADKTTKKPVLKADDNAEVYEPGAQVKFLPAGNSKLRNGDELVTGTIVKVFKGGTDGQKTFYKLSVETDSGKVTCNKATVKCQKV